MPGYSLFDVRKADAARVVNALKGADFFGKRLFSEVAVPDKDYGKASGRRSSNAESNAPKARGRKSRR